MSNLYKNKIRVGVNDCKLEEYGSVKNGKFKQLRVKYF